MKILEETWGNIPLLHIVENKSQDQPIPVVIFLHGFTSAKEHNLHYAYNMAKRGLRVLLPDAHLHGARSENLIEDQLNPRFWEIVLSSIEEVEFLHQELMHRRIDWNGKIGLGGTSMGGITTLGCLSAYEWIDAAAVMMGAPGFVELAKAQIRQYERGGFELPMTKENRDALFQTLNKYDLTKQASRLNQRPLFFWHGKQDTVIPYEPTYQFFKSVQQDYREKPEFLVFDSNDNAGHGVPRDGMLRSAEWMASNL